MLFRLEASRVFKALLHFIYNNSLNIMDDIEGEDIREIVKHLLVAAYRYAMERLKLICEQTLSKRLSAENVAFRCTVVVMHVDVVISCSVVPRSGGVAVAQETGNHEGLPDQQQQNSEYTMREAPQKGPPPQHN
ncbi:hypothetical protein EJB05_08963, partial [Eragrostis curvula]